jgi:hypothetical protein
MGDDGDIPLIQCRPIAGLARFARFLGTGMQTSRAA